MKQSTHTDTQMTWFGARKRQPMGIVVLGADCVAAPPADRELLSD